jgi:hypothetical protein
VLNIALDGLAMSNVESILDFSVSPKNSILFIFISAIFFTPLRRDTKFPQLYILATPPKQCCEEHHGEVPGWILQFLIAAEHCYYSNASALPPF